MELTHNYMKPFVFRNAGKHNGSIAYTAHSEDRWRDEEEQCARLRQLG